MKTKLVILCTILLSLASCSDDDNMNSTDPVLNKNEFVFSKEGGVDTLYSRLHSKYQILSVSLVNTETGAEDYSANLSKQDTVFTDAKGQIIGHISYDGNSVSRIATKWFNISAEDVHNTSPKYIITAAPFESCPYSLGMAISQKNGGASVSVKYE